MDDPAMPPPPDLTGVTVLQVVPALAAGGAERTTVDIAAALVKAGARALVATSGGRLTEELVAVGGEWIALPVQSKNPARIVANAMRLTDLVRAEGVDIVHARSRAPAWSALMAARRTGIAYVSTYHGAYRTGGTLRTFYNSVMARGDAVIANSHFTARRIVEQHPRARSRIKVIHRGLDAAAFAADAIAPERIEALRGRWGIARSRRVVLLPGRLTPWKGQDLLIDAARSLTARPDFEDVDFVLAGEAHPGDAYPDRLTARILEAGLAHRVRLVGHCTDMPAAYALATVVAVPSIGPEAFGRTTVEAQAGGKPVVVSDHGAVTETVLAPPEAEDAERTGWRVPPGDAPALTEAIAEALMLPSERRAELGTRAQRFVTERFSLSRMTGDTLRVYTGLLGSRGSATD